MKELKEILLEKLKIGSKSRVDQKEEFTTIQRSEFKRFAHEELIIPKGEIDREWYENFVRRILNNHSSNIDEKIYNRLHDYIDNHEEDEEIERYLRMVITT